MARYTQLKQSDIEKIAGYYNLEVASFESIEGGAGNSSYLLYVQQAKYVLTVFDEKTLNEVLHMGQLLLLLNAYDFPSIQLLPLISDDIVTVYMGKPIMLKSYIEGEVYEDLDEVMLDQLGKKMARLHEVPSPDYLPDTHSYGWQVFASVIGQNIDTKYEYWLQEQLDFLKQNIPSGLPRGLIHGDLFYDNVLFERNKFKAIIDFEEACHYYKVFDLGMAIVGSCAEGTTIDLDKACALVHGYQEVRQLEEMEKETLQLFVQYAATATSYWRFWKYNIDTSSANNAKKHWEMVKISEWVSSISNVTFSKMIFSDSQFRI